MPETAPIKIIVTGPQGSGKTTLAGAITTMLTGKGVHVTNRAMSYGTTLDQFDLEGHVVSITSQMPDPGWPTPRATAGVHVVNKIDPDVFAAAQIFHTGGHAASVKAFHAHQAHRGEETSASVDARAEGVSSCPDVGPLTSTDGLRPGDVLRCIRDFESSEILIGRGPHVVAAAYTTGIVLQGRETGGPLFTDRFAFVGRPDADGWVPWRGGENPVPDARGGLRFRDRLEMSGGCVFYTWKGWKHSNQPSDVIAFRLDDAVAAGQGEPVESNGGCASATESPHDAATASAEAVRDAVDAINIAIRVAQDHGVSVRVDSLPLARRGCPETEIVTVTCSKEI